MKSTSYLEFFLPGITLILSFFHLAAVMDAGAQGFNLKGGLGSIFKNRSPDETAPVVVGDKKSEALKIVVMELIPADRHYREVLAEAIVIAYRNRGFKNLWNPRQMPDRLDRSLSQQLNRHGLPDSLALSPETLTSGAKRSPVNGRDLGYSVAIADAGALVRLGAVPPSLIWPNWDMGDKPGLNRNGADAIASDLLRITSYRSFDPATAIDTMAPRSWIYRELQNGYIDALKAMMNSSRFPDVPDPALSGLAKPDQPYPHAAALAENLALRGHLDLSPDKRRALQSVTPELTEGIRKFQRANGLADDGVMGSGTWKYLNTNPETNLRLRTINLHRARLLPDDFGKRYVIINLPSAELHAFEEGTHIMSMRIVHGLPEKEFHTPVFRDVMGEVVFAPYWNVPESISVKEIYPKLLEDPTYLESRSYEIVDNFRDDATVFELNEETMAKIAKAQLYLRQKPTAENALGKVKFLLPNQFHVYLHDTPSKQYFTMTDRAQSHGCVRLADPPKMANWTLGKQGWDSSKIEAAMDSPTQIRVKLEDPVNVYITYFTSFPIPTGTSAGEFILAPARDVYKMDLKDAETMAAVLP